MHCMLCMHPVQPMTKDTNYKTKVKGYKNASSPVNRVCDRIPRIPPESATGAYRPIQLTRKHSESANTSAILDFVGSQILCQNYFCWIAKLDNDTCTLNHGCDIATLRFFSVCQF